MMNTQKTDTKTKIIETAQTEFAQFGLAGARVDRIARKAGVNKAMIYYHFHSKEELYKEVVRSFFGRLIEQIQTRFSPDDRLDRILQSILQAQIETFQKNTDLIQIILHGLASRQADILHPASEALLASGLPTVFREKIQTAINEGDLRPVDIRQAAVSFITMSLGYLILSPLLDTVWRISDRNSFLEERKLAIVDLFMNGMKAR